MDLDTAFEEYLNLGRKLTAFYYVERYPPGPVPYYAAEEVRETLEAAEKLIATVSERLGK